jgi:hypothetical protein
MCFYLGCQKQPWFGQANSENARVFRMNKQFFTNQLKDVFKDN